MTREPVNVDNFARAETNRMFAALQRPAINVWRHDRTLGSLDDQTVIRQNRDTLYSAVIADISQGATLTILDAGDRYLSVMVVNQDHYINRIFHGAGEYELTVDEFDTPYVLLAARILVDPDDDADLAAVNALQDGLGLSARSAVPFVMPDYDEASFTSTREALLQLASGIGGFTGAFGPRDRVDPIKHLLGTAAGWGGLPSEEATYLNAGGLPVGEYEVTVEEVPVDAFWSLSVYNADGFFEPNELGRNNVNSVTATRNDDGSITVRFGTAGGDQPNYIPITEGWNYLVRLYRPRPEVLDGSWTFPAAVPV